MLSIIPAALAFEDPDFVPRDPTNAALPNGSFQLYYDVVDYEVLPTYAYVAGGGAGGFEPHIFCKWELPDMDSFKDGIQYSDGDPYNPWDDDDLSYPYASGNGYPCYLDADEAAPVYADGAYSVIQVTANPNDFPEERKIELWAAVGHPAGINAVSDVFWKIYHPDGTFKFQEHGYMAETCDTFGAVAGNSTLTPGSMFWAANGTMQLSKEVITDESSGLVALCNEDQLRFWYGYFDLSKHQPCGEYRVEAYATSTGATAGPLTNYLDVMCYHAALIDFDEVNYDLVIPGVMKQVAGNLIWGDGKPSIANIGPGGANVGVRFSTMYQVSVTDGSEKFIDLFDAKIGINSQNLESWDTIVAYDTPAGDQGHRDLLATHIGTAFDMGRDVTSTGIYWFSYADTSTVCADEVFKLDFSIHPNAGIPADDYEGTVEIWAQPDRGSDDNPEFKNPDGWGAPYTCNNDNGLWGGFQPNKSVFDIAPYGANQRTSSGAYNGGPQAG